MKKPPFKPKPGQIDYTKAKRAPAVNCIVRYKDRILLVQRAPELLYYPNCWNGVSGFLDDEKNIYEKAKEELLEEIGISEKDIVSMKAEEPIEMKSERYDKAFIVSPMLVEVKTDKVKLNWEAQDFEWVKPEEIEKFDVLEGFLEIVKSVGLGEAN
jgi:8-oxo-dGTP pyrophosphatase MutT (NUDIX family)